MALATEKIRFLSTRRCRHFLAAIAPRLLAAIAATPDPDSTLVNLSKVSDSLGGKGVLWELFSFNPPVAAPVRRALLVQPVSLRHPDQQPRHDRRADGQPAARQAADAGDRSKQRWPNWLRGAEDLDPILHSFKNAQQLRVGVRDILGKEDIRATHEALSDIAEACLEQIAESEYEKLVEKLGQPTILLPANGVATMVTSPPPAERAQPVLRPITRNSLAHLSPTAKATCCEPVVLALGELGGREPNSVRPRLDLPLEADGDTFGRRRTARGGTTNGHFFSELGQRVIRVASHASAHGRLYEVDARLPRPGKSSALAVSVDAFGRYFPKATASFGNDKPSPKPASSSARRGPAEHAMQIIADAAFSAPWRRQFAPKSARCDTRLEETASEPQPKTRPRRHGRHRISRADAAAQTRRRRSIDPQARHARSARRAWRTAGAYRPDAPNTSAAATGSNASVEARIRLMRRRRAARAARQSARTGQARLLSLGYPDPRELVFEAEAYVCRTRPDSIGSSTRPSGIDDAA